MAVFSPAATVHFSPPQLQFILFEVYLLKEIFESDFPLQYHYHHHYHRMTVADNVAADKK